MRQCASCGDTLSVGAHPNAKYHAGACSRHAYLKRNREYYARDRIKILESSRLRREGYSEEKKSKINKRTAEITRKNRDKDPVGYLLARAKRRAKERGIVFSLSREDIYIPTLCPVLGVKMSFGGKGKKNLAPSIDRIDPKLGYTPSNVLVISTRANLIKNEFTKDDIEEILAVLKYMSSVKC